MFANLIQVLRGMEKEGLLVIDWVNETVKLTEKGKELADAKKKATRLNR